MATVYRHLGIDLTGTNMRECLLPAAAVGPEGICLVVYSEVRGVDDSKSWSES